MIIVSDTSPLNYLVLIGQEWVLPKLFGMVVTPPSVLEELNHPTAPPLVQAWAAAPPAWLEVRKPSLATATRHFNLDLGEADAIALAIELRADAILIDERLGTFAAQQMGLITTGTLGVLELAAEKGLIKLTDVVAALRQTTFRISERLVQNVLAREAERLKQSSDASGSPDDH